MDGFSFWLRRKDLNQRLPGYEPDELTRLLYSAIYKYAVSQRVLYYHSFGLLSRAEGDFFEITLYFLTLKEKIPLSCTTLYHIILQFFIIML